MGSSAGYLTPPANSSGQLPAPAEEVQGLPRVAFEDGQRAFYVGHTGSGKTYLATAFIGAIPPRLPVVVVDPKHLYPHEDWEPGNGDGWELVDDLPPDWERQVRREKRPSHLRLIVRPEYMGDQRKNTALNDMYERLFDAGLCLVYLDEIQALVHESRASDQLSRLVQMGRAKHISVWGSTLRPAAIPRMFISESDHVFCFRLRDDADKDRMAEIIGPEGKIAPGPGPHDFWYRAPGVDVERPVLVHQ